MSQTANLFLHANSCKLFGGRTDIVKYRVSLLLIVRINVLVKYSEILGGLAFLPYLAFYPLKRLRNVLFKYLLFN